MCLYISGFECIMFNVSLLYFVDFAFVKVYDTIRYDIFSCTKKLMNSQLNLPHRTKIKSSAVAEMGDHLAMVGMGQKVRAGCCAPFRGGNWVPIEHNVAWAKAFFRTKWHLNPSSRFATTDMGRKLGSCAPLSDGAGSLLNTVWSGPSVRPYQVAS